MQKKNEKRVLLSNTIAFGVGTLGAKVIMFFCFRSIQHI